MFTAIKNYRLNRKINRALKIASSIVYSEPFITDHLGESEVVLDKITSRNDWEFRLILNFMFRAIAREIMEFNQSKLDVAKRLTTAELNSMRDKLTRYGRIDFNELLPLYFDKEEAMTSMDLIIARVYLTRMRDAAIKNPYSYDGMCFNTQMAKRQSLTAIEKAKLKGKATEIEALETRIAEMEKEPSEKY